MLLQMYAAFLRFMAKPEVVQSEVKDKVFHALVNLGIPLSNRQEILIFRFMLVCLKVIPSYPSVFANNIGPSIMTDAN